MPSTPMSGVIPYLLAVAFLFPTSPLHAKPKSKSMDAAAASETDAATEEESGDAAPVAKKKKKRKKRRGMRRAKGEAFSGAISFSFLNFSSEQTTTEFSEGDPIKSSSTGINLNVDYLFFVMNQLALGPLLSLNNNTSTYEAPSIDETSGEVTSEEQKSTSNVVKYGLSAKYFIFDPNRESFVPYGKLNLAMGKSSSESGEVSESSNLSEYTLGFGMAYFLAKNFALDSGLTYTISSDKDSETVANSGRVDLFIGFTGFI